MSAVKQLNEAMNHHHLGAESETEYLLSTQANATRLMDALQSQEGGDHYKKLKIQPMEYSMANGLDACQHTVVKYVTRFRDKGGIQDLRKAIHTLEMLIEFEGRS